tara:strand:+ start:416 stop:574 length:159 start_codon:yes stop_codon:yes gene_type:complete
LKTDEKYEFGSPYLGAIQASRLVDYKQLMEFFLIVTWAFIAWVLKTQNPFKN